MELHLMRPEWLWSLLPATLLAWLLWRQRLRSGSWSSVIAPELLPHLVARGSGERQRNWTPWLLLGWCVAALAAAGPSWEKIPQPVHQKQDALVLLLDLSYSMKSADLAPSRTDRARQKLLDLLAERKEGQTALIAYAGDAHIVTPLTDDTPTIANLLPALHPDMMPVPGSDPHAAVKLGLNLLQSGGIRQGQMILLTDGVREADVEAIGELLEDSPVQLSVLAVGTRTGAPIPLPRGGFVKDKNGAIVMPGLQPGPLRALAKEGRGRYRVLQVDDSDIEYLLAASSLPDTEQTLVLDRTADTWDDKGYLLALLLLPAALLLFRRGVLLCLLPAMFILPVDEAIAERAEERAESAEEWAQRSENYVPSSEGTSQSGENSTAAYDNPPFGWDDLWLTRDQQGQRSLRNGDPQRAASLFEQPDWAGTAAYESGDYARATDKFSQGDSADAWYNRGNALARQGKLDEAIAAYEASLSREPEQKDATENLELLKKLREQQELQQNQQGGEDQDTSEQQQQGDSQPPQNQNNPQNAQSDTDQQQGNPQDSQQPSSDEQQGAQTDTQPPQEQYREEQEEEQQAQQDRSESDPSEGEQQQASPTQAEPQAGDKQGEQQPAQLAQTDPEQAERDQAMEQWLRRVPDDPSGLLRQKFRYESERRKQEGRRSDSDVYW